MGKWLFRFRIHTQTLPFNAEILESNGKLQFFAVNGDERIRADAFEVREDSVFIRLPIFNTALIGKITDDGLEGNFFDYSRKGDYRIPFTATRSFENRFRVSAQPSVDV